MNDRVTQNCRQHHRERERYRRGAYREKIYRCVRAPRVPKRMNRRERQSERENLRIRDRDQQYKRERERERESSFER